MSFVLFSCSSNTSKCPCSWSATTKRVKGFWTKAIVKYPCGICSTCPEGIPFEKRGGLQLHLLRVFCMLVKASWHLREVVDTVDLMSPSQVDIHATRPPGNNNWNSPCRSNNISDIAYESPRQIHGNICTVWPCVFVLVSPITWRRHARLKQSSKNNSEVFRDSCGMSGWSQSIHIEHGGLQKNIVFFYFSFSIILACFFILFLSLYIYIYIHVHVLICFF